MTRAVAYLRVSTEGQVGEDKFGLADQKAAVDAFVKAHPGFELVKIFSDEGLSGATMDRPGLQDLLAEAASGTFDVVIVARLDRLARDLMAQLWIEKELLRHNVELISAGEPFRGQDPVNVLFRQIIGAFAQFEKARITERLKGGRKQKARDGGYAGGAPPIGYRAKRGAKTLLPDEEKRETVRKAFELREQHPEWSLQTIADQLNRMGHTTAQGCRFHKMQAKRLLDRREFYEGKYRYAGIEAQGKHQPILQGEVKTWRTC